MKLDARRIEPFLRDPGSTRAVLLHGDDTGLIHERATRLVRAAAGTTDDPFRVVELDRESFAGIPDEMASLALTGGRRVIWVREATDAATNPVKSALDGPGTALLVLEAAGLARASKLRTLMERAADAAAIACYPLEGRALEAEIRARLADRHVTADAETFSWLASQLGGDQGVTLSEIEKLALYAGPNGTIDITAARLCVGDLAGLSLDDALFSATSGNVPDTDRALERALAEGATPVGILRSLLSHIQRLQRARAAMAEGSSASDAAKSARPPVFFKRESSFIQALTLWPLPELDRAATRAFDAENACKRTGSPADTICRNAVLGLAQRGAAAKGRKARGAAPGPR